MFAALTIEHEPLTFIWDTFLGSLNSWTQIAGGFAALCLFLWFISFLASGGRHSGSLVIWVVLLWLLLGPLGLGLFFLYVYLTYGRLPSIDVSGFVRERGRLFVVLFLTSALGALLIYQIVLPILYLPDIIQSIRSEALAVPPPEWKRRLLSVLWTVAGAAALFAVVLPILADLPRISLRRVGAIARLCLKEAVRRKVLWVFLALLLVVLFGSWFVQDKPENQVRTYVQLVFLAMGLVMLVLMALIASFGIPEDIRQQTIHTVLTKPVQRFEVFLGRFLGYTALMTGALVVVTGFALLYVMRNINPEAARESLKAREPLYGALSFQGTKEKDKGENVGREWDYRTYIVGKPPNATDPTQYAVWGFDKVPAALLDRPRGRLEFALDIYRTHKGVEGKGIFCTFLVESWRFDADNPVRMKEYNTRKAQLEAENAPDVADTLAEEFGYFEYPAMEIKDYHTQGIDVPAGVFKNAAKPASEADRDRQDELRRRREWPAAPLRVRVRCDSSVQFVGMAKPDLYFRLDHDDAGGGWNKARFALNFYKGSFGLWLRLCLMIGLAVALSTYLSGVITLLTTAILYVLGFFPEFINEVAKHRNVGGGPLESMMRLVKRPGGEPIAGQLDNTTTATVATGLDKVFSWSLDRFLNLIPDLANYTFTDYVAEGMSISLGQMTMSLLVLVGYLLPWAVLAYYLLKWREVASST
jgi:ABC-type transport system involved in multi-copper enzyme maturation permease subunit